MAQKSTRRRVFVSRDIQGTILFRLARYWVFYHLGLWAVLLVVEFFQQLVGSLFQGQMFSMTDLMGNFLHNNRFILIAPVLLFPVVLWDMTRLTHKVAGPLVRFRSALSQLTAGETVEKIRLRDGDLLTEFQDTFNEYLDSMAVPHQHSSVGADAEDSHSQEVPVLTEV